MKRERRVQPVPLLVLASVWVLLWGNLTVANVLSGLVLGALVLVVFPLPRLIVGIRVRPVPFVVLTATFLTHLVTASVQVAWLAVRPGSYPRNSVLVVQLEGREELFQTVVAEMTSLVPGSIVIDLDADNGRLALHVLGADTPEKVAQMRSNTLRLERRVHAALAASDGSIHTSTFDPSTPDETPDRGPL